MLVLTVTIVIQLNCKEETNQNYCFCFDLFCEKNLSQFVSRHSLTAGTYKEETTCWDGSLQLHNKHTRSVCVCVCVCVCVRKRGREGERERGGGVRVVLESEKVMHVLF